MHLKLHAQLIGEARPMSGRCGGHVYYWAYGHLCWRRHVIPRDPRTPLQQRSRAALRAASIAWSQAQLLTEAQLAAWRAAAAKIKSRPRLGTWGFLTAQQHYVGSNSLKERWGLPLLLEPAQQGMRNAECKIQKAESAPKALQLVAVSPGKSAARRPCPVSTPSPRPAADDRARKLAGYRVPTQVSSRQALTRAPSERYRCSAGALPMQHLWPALSPNRLGRIGWPPWPSAPAQFRRSARVRELWRGG